jgi:hypothetical protein
MGERNELRRNQSGGLMFDSIESPVGTGKGKNRYDERKLNIPQSE